MGEIYDLKFGGIADVNGADLGGIHEADGHLNEIVDVTEGASLRAVAVDGEGVVVERLNDEIGDDAPIVGMHPRAVGIENAGDLDGDVIFAVVVEEKSLSAPLPFVVTGAITDGVDIAPIIFLLRMDVGIAVNFAGGGLKDFAFEPFG